MLAGDLLVDATKSGDFSAKEVSFGLVCFEVKRMYMMALVSSPGPGWGCVLFSPTCFECPLLHYAKVLVLDSILSESLDL